MDKPDKNIDESDDNALLGSPDEYIEATEGEVQHGHGRRRKRVKIRRRIRIKKKISKKRKARKTLETLAWVLIIAAFLTTLIILILQLDLTDKRTKKAQGKDVSELKSEASINNADNYC